MFALRDYQKKDVEKSLKQIAILNANDMGSGKTIEAIETFKTWRYDVLKETGLWLPILIVTPQNTFESWANKLNIQCPEWSYHILDRTALGREAFVVNIARFTHDIYITNYESMRVMQPNFEKFKFQFSIVCADEVHAISNRKAQQTAALKKIKAHRKLAMSGTPTGSKPQNIWSILNWLYPTYYTSYWRFIRQYCEVESKTVRHKVMKLEQKEKQGAKADSYVTVTGMKNMDLFHMEIAPFYIRHNKKSYCCPEHPNGVMEHLPDKSYEQLYVDLLPEQRRIYNEMHKNMVAWVGEQMETPFIAKIAAVKLMRLMQTTLATPVVTWDEDGNQLVNLTDPSPKIDLVKQLVTDDETKNFIVYSNSKKAAYLCGKALTNIGVSNRVLSGDTPRLERQSFVSDFQSGRIRVIVAVIRASEGFDGLQDVCDTIIFLNRELSAFKNQQAEDRLHREGQNNPVTIIDILARDTLDAERLNIDNMSWQMLLDLLDAKRDNEK